MKKQEDLKQRLYKILFDKSTISSGVRCINEEDWPINEISKELATAKQEMVERVKRYERRYPIMSKVEQLGMNSIDYKNLGYNQAITDIINELSKSER